MSRAQRAAVSAHMKAYWARRRKAKVDAQEQRVAGKTTATGISLQTKDELAKIGARVRLTELDAERERLQRFLRTG
jgi:hypothetical protein